MNRLATPYSLSSQCAYMQVIGLRVDEESAGDMGRILGVCDSVQR